LSRSWTVTPEYPGSVPSWPPLRGSSRATVPPGECATTTTDEKGNYSFDKLPAGAYSVNVVQDGPIASLEQTGDPDATKDNSSEPITLNNDNPSKTGWEGLPCGASGSPVCSRPAMGPS